MVWGCQWDHSWGALKCSSTAMSLSGINTTGIDAHRQGASVISDKHRYAGVLLRLNSGQKDNRQSSPISHAIEQTTFGQPPIFESEGGPFVDQDKFNPVLYLNTSKLEGVEFKSSTAELENFGAIEPLIIRDAIKFTSTDFPLFAHDVHGSLMDGNEDALLRSDKVIQFIPTSDPLEQVPYVDTVGHRGETTEGAIELITTSSNKASIRNPFDDSRPETLFSGAPDADRLTGDSGIDAALRLMTGNRDNDFRPKEHKSAQAGFTYRNNPEGTDSIAFGGLKK